jgi:LysM repeat protein
MFRDRKEWKTMKTRILLAIVLLGILLTGASDHAEASSCTPVYHTVKVGQNLTQIAQMYWVTVQAIVRANNLWNPNVIYVGQRLLIPVPCPPEPLPKCTKIHVVKRGEYLKLIAARYGTTVTVLVKLNGIRNPNLIYPGQRLKVPTTCPTPPTPEPTPPPSTGAWKGQYWDNRFLSGAPAFTRKNDRVNHDFGTDGPGGGIGGTNFSVRWTRTRSFDAGRYRFRVVADDGVRVWLDNVLIIDEWHDQAPTEYVSVHQVSAGDHSLQIDYYQHLGGARMNFAIEPVEVGAAWKAEYFNNTTLEGEPDVVRFYPSIDFDYGPSAPVAGVTADYYSTRFTGEFAFVEGKYRFTATVDDGVRIYLDDNLILDQWHRTSVRTYEVDVDVSEGKHSVRVEYYEEKGASVIKVRWVQR